MADRREKAAATAHEYHQGTIASLDDAMTRRLVASTVMTESNGGDLAITNKQGYVGRYQAGAGWLADAGYVDKDKLNAAMKRDGYDPATVRGAEWKWASAGGMTRFLDDKSNWNQGMSLDQYKGSAELQDKAFKINSDKAYRQAVKDGVLNEDSKPELVAGFLKARHIAGYGGAKAAVTGGRAIRDANGTSNYDYLHDITRDRDGLNAYMKRDPKTLSRGDDTQPAHPARAAANAPAMADGLLKHGERGAEVRAMQETLNKLGYRDSQGHPLRADGDYGDRTGESLRNFQRTHGLKDDGVAGPKTLEALKQAAQTPLLSNPAHPDHGLYKGAVEGLEKLGPNAFKNRDELERTAGTLAYEAKIGGFKQIDHIVPTANGAGLFAVQGGLSDPGHQRIHVDKQQAANQPLEQSTLQAKLDAPQASPSQDAQRNRTQGL
ncbi:peptidoglycan-binding domain-containing protein [Lysobacter enzymogenes]|uniref:peptidoglycan-binding domain-containing protein n=1 Tax=Lysobacter enzymogenes TaxID=69 RepID=UPI001F618E2D|nr:peptidoglycan-binding domain-containing protein [Lysobacter enzymogenes]